MRAATLLLHLCFIGCISSCPGSAMVRKCAVKGCWVTEADQGKMLISFPRDSVRRTVWLNGVCLNESNFRKSWKICENHFGPEEWEKVRQDGTRKLRSGATPRLITREENDENNEILTRGRPTCPKRLLTEHSYARNTAPVQRILRDISNTPQCAQMTDNRDIELRDPSVIDSQNSVEVLENSSRDFLEERHETRFSAVGLDHCYSQDSVRPAFLESHVDNVMDTAPLPKDLMPAVELCANSMEISHGPEEWICESELFDDPIEVGRPRESFVVIHSGSDDGTANVGTAMPEVPPLQSTNEELQAFLEEKEKALVAAQLKLEAVTKAYHKVHKQYVTVRRTNVAYRSKIKRLQKNGATSLAKLRRVLNEDQIQALCRSSTRGLKWSSATVKRGLVFKMKWGSRGYTDFVKEVPLFPSARTLQKAVQEMSFESAILRDVFNALSCELVPKMSHFERRCVVVIDEMAIREGEAMDPSTGKIIGQCTFPPHQGKARKALVVMLAGVSTRWKFPVAYYFTSSKKGKKDPTNEVGRAMKSIVFEVIWNAEGVGLMVEAFVSDMGPDNLALWRELGVGCPAQGEVRCWIPHPCRPTEKLWILPDPVHLHKNIHTCLANNKVIYLPDNVVKEEGLSSPEVNIQELDQLVDFEEGHELKVAYRLNADRLHCKNQFEKMRVSTSASVFNKRTEAALRAKAAQEGKDPSTLSIAFFIMLITRWFDLSTNRSAKLALRKDNATAYEGALSHIRKMAYVFRYMKIGDGKWRPVQTGVLMFCEAILGLQDYFLNVVGFSFLLTARFTQDCIENLFSLIRFRQPLPNAVLFKQNLKVITLTQLCLTSMNTSYACDVEDSDLDDLHADFITYSQQLALERGNKQSDETQEARLSVPHVTDDHLPYLGQWEWYILYDMAGAVLRSLQKMNVKTCDTCLNAVKWHGENPHPYSMIVHLKNYRADCLIEPSDHCFRAIMKAEITFRLLREPLKSMQQIDHLSFLCEQLEYVWEGAAVPRCHDLTSKILRRFLTMRFRIFGVQKKGKPSNSGKYSSKTVGMHAAVE